MFLKKKSNCFDILTFLYFGSIANENFVICAGRIITGTDLEFSPPRGYWLLFFLHLYHVKGKEILQKCEDFKTNISLEALDSIFGQYASLCIKK